MANVQVNHDDFNNEPMISWAAIFLMIAIVAGIVGLGGIAGPAVGIAKILCLVFLALFLVTSMLGRKRHSP